MKDLRHTTRYCTNCRCMRRYNYDKVIGHSYCKKCGASSLFARKSKPTLIGKTAEFKKINKGMSLSLINASEKYKKKGYSVTILNDTKEETNEFK